MNYQSWLNVCFIIMLLINFYNINKHLKEHKQNE